LGRIGILGGVVFRVSMMACYSVPGDSETPLHERIFLILNSENIRHIVYNFSRLSTLEYFMM
jgi:hypothetical protein